MHPLSTRRTLRVGFALEVFQILEGEEAGERDAERLDALAGGTGKV
jgi:hypothetical protein